MNPPERRVLLTPGPATTTDSVKLAQVVPDICPREEEFAALLRSIVADLARLIGAPADAQAVLLAGSGTAAVEAMVTSLAGEGGLVVVNNGAYGERIARIARTYGIRVLEFRSSPTEPIELASLDRALAARPSGMSQLALVHHETTTGLLNDLPRIGALCRNHGMQMLTDAISSFGACPIDMEAMNLAALASSANKNLQAMAGVSFVLVRGEALAAARTRRPRSFYLDLCAQSDYFTAHGQMRFTAPVQTLYALRRALDELLAEGVGARMRRYAKSWEVLIEGMQARGFAMAVPRHCQSRLITALDGAAVPGFSFARMHDFLLARGFTIYPGKLPGRETFRVANIGDITERDIRDFLAALDAYLAGCRA